jgi:hypothetical protein
MKEQEHTTDPEKQGISKDLGASAQEGGRSTPAAGFADPPASPSRGLVEVEGYTPGPWEAKLCRIVEGSPVVGYRVVAGKKLHSLANVGVYEHEPITGPDPDSVHPNNRQWAVENFYTEGELIANALLISQAPAMQERIKELEGEVANADRVIRRVYEALSSDSRWDTDKLLQFIFKNYLEEKAG